MIALNREMPQDCFKCPCLGTYSIDDDDGELHLLRQCHACDKLIYHAVFSDYKKDKIIQQKWMNLPRPEWCPWIDLK